MTQKEYQNEVNRMARELYEEAVQDGNRTWDDISDYFYKEIPVRVSDHSFVQFKHWHPVVMEHADNPNAYFEFRKRGSYQDFENYSDAMSQFAQAAFHQDTLDAFNDFIDVWLLDLKETDDFADNI